MSARTLRVVVADDSSTVRRVLVAILERTGDIEVVGEAADGARAVELCELLRPDVVTLDLQMPQMSGLDATRHIMDRCPTPILIVSASINRGEALKTFDALAAGAVDIHDKSSLIASDPAWCAAFVARVRMIAGVAVVGRRVRAEGGVPTAGEPGPPSSAGAAAGGALDAASGVMPARKVVLIGASTGGPAAVVAVLNALPILESCCVAVVQHVSGLFAESLRAWFDSQVPHPVRIVREPVPLATATGVWLPPADRHLAVRGGCSVVDGGPERHSCRPSVDVLFESAAPLGERVIAALLTGMGRDGALGLAAIRRSGGMTFVQDAETSVVYGMPAAALALGAARRVLPIGEIGPAIAHTLSAEGTLRRLA